jgi:hypothetical protein
MLSFAEYLTFDLSADLAKGNSMVSFSSAVAVSSTVLSVLGTNFEITLSEGILTTTGVNDLGFAWGAVLGFCAYTIEHINTNAVKQNERIMLLIKLYVIKL